MSAGERPVLGVHGIWNLESRLDPEEVSLRLEDKWGAALATGYADAQLTESAPQIAAVYYAHLLADNRQGGMDDLEHLTAEEKDLAWAWMKELGVPQDHDQGYGTWPLRQGLDWLARQPGRPGRALLARVMAALLRELFVYLSRPATRRRVQQAVINAWEEYRPQVIIAHSLGSVVTYEALHARPDIDLPLLVTMGSPLGLAEFPRKVLVVRTHPSRQREDDIQ